MNGARRGSGGRRASVRAALVLSAMLIAAGCGGGSDTGSTGGPQPAVAHRRLQVDGVDRTYRLFTPPDVESAGPVPLVLALHGAGNTADSLVDSSELDQAASAGGFIVAYPEALGLVWNGGFCCTSGRGDRAVDVHFLDGVITEISAMRRIDQTRIYAIGVSAGGIMAYRMACDMAPRFAGIGAIAASMVLDDCSPSRAVSVIAINGTADPIVPYDGGRIAGGATKPAPPASAVVERWAALDGCPNAGTTEVRGALTTTTWADCAGGTRVRLVSVDGGGHNWFLPVYGPPNGALDATVAIAEYFGLRRR